MRRDDPHRAIELLEDVDSIFDPRVRYFHPGEGRGFSLEREMDRLPTLYERVGRFEDALKFTPVSFAHFGWGMHPADVAVRRLNCWVVSKGGYGKSTPLSGYPTQGRGGQGVRTFRVTAKTGPVAAARVVPNVEGQEIFIISEKGQVIRMTLQDVRVTGRNTPGRHPLARPGT